jgi:CDP-glucose 4,6-dehydratase
MELSGVFKNRKVLVTGHTGFKGAWLTLWLVELGAQVIGYSLDPPTEPNLFSILNLSSRITDIRADIRNQKRLADVFRKYKPEIVFHLAAQALVKESYRFPRDTYETNVMGTVNLFEAARGCPSVKVIIDVTTDKCYENKNIVYAYKETDPLGGYDPYSSSKACSEIVAAAYRSSFFNPADFGKKHNVSVSTARAGNVIGGGDWAKDRLIPDCIRSLSSKKSVEIRSPAAVRPWQFVLEPVSGYLNLAALMWEDGPKYGQAWNFGPDPDGMINVESIVKTMVKTWGNGSYNVKQDTEHHEAGLLMLDNAKAKKMLNWKPVYSTGQAIEKTAEWYRQYYSAKDSGKYSGKEGSMYDYSLQQIKEYAGSALKEKKKTRMPARGKK